MSVDASAGGRAPSSAPSRFEVLLAGGATAVLAAVLLAVVRGRAAWNSVPPPVWLHLATIAVSLALTPSRCCAGAGCAGTAGSATCGARP